MKNSDYTSFGLSDGQTKDIKWNLYLKNLQHNFALCSSTFLYTLGEIKKYNDNSTNHFYKKKTEGQIQDFIDFHNRVEEIINAYQQHASEVNNKVDKLTGRLAQNKKIVLERLRSFYIHICNREDRLEEQQVLFDIICELDKLYDCADN